MGGHLEIVETSVTETTPPEEIGVELPVDTADRELLLGKVDAEVFPEEVGTTTAPDEVGEELPPDVACWERPLDEIDTEVIPAEVDTELTTVVAELELEALIDDVAWVDKVAGEELTVVMEEAARVVDTAEAVVTA